MQHILEPEEVRCVMNSNVSTQQILVEEKREAAKTVFGGSRAENIASGAAIVLSLIGLSGIMRDAMLPLAVLTAGSAFLIEGGAVSMRFSDARLERVDFGIGITAEFLAGVSGIVLGILSVLGLSPMLLLPVAVSVYGGALMLSDLTMRLNNIEFKGISVTKRFKKIAHEIAMAVIGVEFLFGLGAIILGIMGFRGHDTVTLSLVATLLIGISGVVTGAAVTAKMADHFRAGSE